MVSTKPMQYIVGMCAVLLWSLLGEYAERFDAQENQHISCFDGTHPQRPETPECGVAVALGCGGG